MTSMINDHHILWRSGEVECVMISCCAGAELQLRRPGGVSHAAESDVLLRELYPSKSDLYERARQLEAEHRTTP